MLVLGQVGGTMPVCKARTNGAFGTTMSLACCILCITCIAVTLPVQAQTAPIYKVDPFWPKMPLPNKWIIQGVPTHGGRQGRSHLGDEPSSRHQSG